MASKLDVETTDVLAIVRLPMEASPGADGKLRHKIKT